MTEGSIAKNIILFYIPLAIGGLFQQLYSFVDSVVVGRGIGAQALAAVGATSIVVWLTLGFAMGLTRGFCIHISQAYGKKDYHLVNRGFFVAKKWPKPLFWIAARVCMHAFGAHWPLDRCKKLRTGRSFLQIDSG